MPSSGVRAWDEPAALAPTRRRLGPLALAEWLANNFLAERARWSLWLPVFMGAGIGIYFWLRFEPPLWLGPAALTVTVAAVVAAAKHPRFLNLIAPAAIATALALGFALAQFQTWLVAAPVLEYRLGPVAVEGRIVSIDPLPEGTRLVVAPRYIERLAPDATPARVRVRLRGDAEGMLPGDWLRLRAILMPPPAPAMPGAYDFERRAYFDRLGAVGFALGVPQAIPAPVDAQPSRWRGLIAATRTNVTSRLRAALPGRDGAIASAIITGATHAIPPEDAGAFRDAGLAHILVIAGLHMGMLAGIVFFAVRAMLALIPALALRYSIKKWAAFAALLASFCYLLLSDATVSSRRAFVMVALMLLGIMLDRVTFSARTLAYAAVGIMVLAPDAATGPSFQMSFAAVCGLVACYEALRPRMAQWHAGAGFARRAGLYLCGIALTTVITTLATMPFTIYHFNRFPIYSIAANIVAVPITGFWIMPWAILSMLAMPFGLESWPLQPMGWGIEAVARIAHGVTGIPGAVLHVPSMPAVGLALLAAGGLWLCIWTRRWRALALAPLAAGYASIFLAVPPDILVSGNGNLVAVRAADGSYLPSSARRDAWTEDIWTQRAAATLGPAWPRSGVSSDGRLSCDATACLYRLGNRTVAFPRGKEEGAACGQADLVIDPASPRSDCGVPVIDVVAVWRNGGHEIRLTPDGIAVETVADWRGRRPWTHEPAPADVSSAATILPISPEP